MGHGDPRHPLSAVRRRTLLASLGMAALPATPRGTVAQAQRLRGRELVATAFGGPSQDLIQRLVFDWLSRETGARTSQTPLLSAQGFARMRAEAQSPQIDLFMFSGGQERPAKADGLTQPIPDAPHSAAVPADLRDPERHWIAWGLVTEGILYRTDRVPEPPRSYRDFFRPEFEGHIAFPHVTNGYGTDFLVMLARIFGGGESNIGPGLEAMRRIAARATIFRAAAEVQTLFANGDIWIMPYDGASAMRSAAMGLPVAYAVPEEGAPFVLLVGCVARRSRNADIASAVLDRHLDTEVQEAIAREIGWAPTNTRTALPQEVARFMARTDQLARLDRGAINASRAAWTERWNREIAAR
jgi:putative spermidine/putrescine transport system substrate-binding protein